MKNMTKTNIRNAGSLVVLIATLVATFAVADCVVYPFELSDETSRITTIADTSTRYGNDATTHTVYTLHWNPITHYKEITTRVEEAEPNWTSVFPTGVKVAMFAVYGVLCAAVAWGYRQVRSIEEA